MNKKDIPAWINGCGRYQSKHLPVALVDLLKELLFPGRCPICGRVLPHTRDEAYVHSSCLSRLTPTGESVCVVCGKILHDPDKEWCEDCKETTRRFVCGRSLWLQDRYMSRSLYEFKYANAREYREFYGSELAARYEDLLHSWQVDALVPVPVHPRKYRIRGYNQAEQICQVLSRRTGIPMESGGLVRLRETGAQKNLGREARRRNLAHAFACTGSVFQGRRVCLIDDIFTTGSTLDACAEALMQGGADRVFFLTVTTGEEES